MFAVHKRRSNHALFHRRLSPRDTFLSDFELYNAFAYFAGSRYEATLRYALQAHRLRPGHVYPLILPASSAGYSGKLDLAATLLDDLRSLVPNVSVNGIDMTSPFIIENDRARLVGGLIKGGLS